MMVLKISTVIKLKVFLNDGPKRLKGSKKFLYIGAISCLNQRSKKYLIKLGQGITNQSYLVRML